MIGDLGGHRQVLQDILTTLGVAFDSTDPSSHQRALDLDWPVDLHIVQVGDLVHRGPDSLGVITLVSALIQRGVWTQIVGNHEQLYVDHPVFDWPESIPDLAVSTLRAWWQDQLMVPAAAVETTDGDWLITHAGLTAGFWEHGLGSPGLAVDALAGLAEARADGALWFPGAMLTGSVNHCAGPVWAAAGSEVYSSWLSTNASMPFHQAHGHSAAFAWDLDLWRASQRVQRSLDCDPTTRHITFSKGNRRIVGIDPGHGHQPAPNYAPLILHNAKVRT